MNDETDGSPTSSASPMSTATALSRDDETIVAAFDTVLEAEMARGRLETDGIPSRILDGNTVGIAAHLSMALGGAKVVVAHSDLEAARSILFSPSTFEDLDAAALESSDRDDVLHAVHAAGKPAALSADDRAVRALKASVFGILFVPPVGHLWSLGVLLSVWRDRAALSPRGRRQALTALVVDGAVLAGSAFIAVSLLL